MSPTKFSIIVPCYNVEKYIDECIESVMKQSYGNWELVLVDDESSDKTVLKVEEWCKIDHRISLYFKKHSGLPATRNEGLRHISGDYVCLLDGDDYWEKNHLKNLWEIINEESFDMIIQNQHTDVYDECSNDVILFPQSEELISRLDVIFSLKNRLPAAAVLTSYKREFIESNGLLYNEELNCSEDLDFFLNAISKNPQITFAFHKFYFYRHNNPNAMTYSMNGSMHHTRNMIIKKWIEYYTENDVGLFEGKIIARKLASELCRQIYDIRLNVGYDDAYRGVINKFIRNNRKHLIWKNHMLLYYLYLNVFRYHCVMAKRFIFDNRSWLNRE